MKLLKEIKNSFSVISKISIQDLHLIGLYMAELRRLSKRLHRAHENQCNGVETDRQAQIYCADRISAENAAKRLGFKIYIQTDPRGCALYLGDETMNETNYNTFLAIES